MTLSGSVPSGYSFQIRNLSMPKQEHQFDVDFDQSGVPSSFDIACADNDNGFRQYENENISNI